MKAILLLICLIGILIEPAETLPFELWVLILLSSKVIAIIAGGLLVKMDKERDK